MRNPQTRIKDFIKAEANRLGFDLIGFTNPSPPQSFAIFENWLAQGRHAGMAYLARPDAVERRANPQLILPGVKTIVVVALRYPRPQDAPAFPAQPTGKIAAYAWGEDYHQTIPQRLSELVHRLREETQTPFEWKILTDSGPVLERDLAQRAGLGWIGKNGCLINPRLGSYFLLGELFLTLEIEPDQPFETDHCGSCQRCIQSCPTHCILPDRTLDAGRCISYLTIENKGAIPPNLREAVGEWVFGCDICQQVCPWNLRFARPQNDPAFYPNPELSRPHLIREIRLSPGGFNEKFNNTPVKRAKRRGFLRNVAVALGNAGGADALLVLGECIRSESEPLVRAHMVWALGQIGGDTAVETLERALQIETDPLVIAEINLALQKLSIRKD